MISRHLLSLEALFLLLLVCSSHQDFRQKRQKREAFVPVNGECLDRCRSTRAVRAVTRTLTDGLTSLTDAVGTHVTPAVERSVTHVRTELLPAARRSAERHLHLLRSRVIPSVRRSARRGYRRMRTVVLPTVADATARMALDVADGMDHVVDMVQTHVVPKVSEGAQMLRRKTEPMIRSAIDRVGRKVLGSENHRMVKTTVNSALDQFNEMRSAITDMTSEITLALSPADYAESGYYDDDIDRDDTDASTTTNRDGESRGLFKDLVNSALYLAGSRVADPNVTSSLTPISRPLVNHLVSVRDPVSFEDGRIVFGLGSSPESGSGSASDKEDATAATPTAASTSSARACTTPQGTAGECRDLSACPQLLLDLGNLRSSICFQQIFLPGVCCPGPSTSAAVPNGTTTESSQPATTRRPPRPRPTSRPRPSPGQRPQRPRPTSAAQLPTVFRPQKPGQSQIRCGQPLAPEYRIVGGDASRPGQWPWMAAIYLHGNGRKEFWCGASLISERYVMTAAHCTKDANGKSFHPRQFTVRLGDYDLSSNEDASAPATYNVASYRTHPDFKINGFYNDLALFRLARSADLNEYVVPVCLPVEYEARALDSLAGATPSVIGWGTTYYGGQESAVLRHAELPVWGQKDCDRAYFQPIKEIFICAGYADGGKDACQGDSGGPLVYYEFGHWMQIGIVSFGNRCAKPGYPGVYTRITHFLPWIRENIS